MELRRELEAARLREHDARNLAVFTAWQVERIRIQTKRGKTSVRMVDLKKALLPEPGAKRGQTAQQMRGALLALSARYGIPMRRARG